MKRVARIGLLGGYVVVALLLSLANALNVKAATPPPPTTVVVQPTPAPSTAPNLIFTSIVGSSLLDYSEIYNQGDDPLHLADWSVSFTVHDASAGCADISATVPLPDAWLLSKKIPHC